MANFKEEAAAAYDWAAGGVYVLEEIDLVEGGEEGTSNRQGRELALRTRNLHERLAALKQETTDSAAELAEAIDSGTSAALRSAQEYADGIVAALVDGSPEALNTLQELSAALGDDPNFATTVMQLIGERATMAQVNAALAGKADAPATLIDADLNTLTRSGLYTVDGGNLQNTPVPTLNCRVLTIAGNPYRVTQIAQTWDADRIFFRRKDEYIHPWRELWHSGNFDPAAKVGTENHGCNSLAAIPFFPASEVIGLNVANVEASAMLNMTYSGEVVQLKISDFMGRLSAHIRGNSSNVWRELYHSGNLDGAKLNNLPQTIIRGSVNASGYTAGGNASGIIPLGDSMVRVMHNLGNTNYAATATVNCGGVALTQDNEVNMWSKQANYVDFVVTNGGGQDREFTPFDFIIIPY